MSARITASIVIYKSDPKILEKAISSFLESTAGSTIYLIDNSPTNKVGHLLDHPRIQYHYNNKNVGFGTGHNIALKKVLDSGTSDYHIVLNPDVYFNNQVVEKMTGFMDMNKDVGLAMPKVLYPDGRLQPLCKMLPSPLTLFSRRFLRFTPGLVYRINHQYEMHFSGYDKIMDVPFLSGCFMFLRVRALQKVGIFDENIFLFTEDTDLSRRMHQFYRTVFFPEVTIYHYHQRESYRNMITMMHHIRSAVTYFNKWGWFNDDERECINERTLLKLQQ